MLLVINKLIPNLWGNVLLHTRVELIYETDYITLFQDEIYLNLVLEYIPETVYKVPSSYFDV